MSETTERPRTIHIGTSLAHTIQFPEVVGFSDDKDFAEAFVRGNCTGGFALAPKDRHSLQSLLSEIVNDFVENRSRSVSAAIGTYEDQLWIEKNPEGPPTPSFIMVNACISLHSLTPKELLDTGKIWEIVTREETRKELLLYENE